jgi:hypothetical protein
MAVNKNYKPINFFSTVLSSPIDNLVTTCVVNTPPSFPNNKGYLIFDQASATSREICEITNVSGNTLTLLRNADNTNNQAHAAGATVDCVPNAAYLNDLIDSYSVGHNADGTHKSGTIFQAPVFQVWDGWVDPQESWVYASATTITVPSGATSKYNVGDKIKLTQTTVKYFSIVGVASTVLTITGGTDYTLANSAITSNFYSKVENPQGFPHWFNYSPTPTYTGTTPPSSQTSGYIQDRFRVTGHKVEFHSYHVYGTPATSITQVTFPPPVPIGSFPTGTTGQIVPAASRVGGSTSSGYVNGELSVIVVEFPSGAVVQWGVSGFYEI